MKLVITLEIEFGSMNPPTAEMDEIRNYADRRLHGRTLDPICNTFGATATAKFDWQPSGDEKE